MRTYFVTVGQRYRSEEHPLGLHPDGYAKVVAPNHECARTAVIEACGTKWAFIYQDDEFNFEIYPLGELAVISYGDLHD